MRGSRDRLFDPEPAPSGLTPPDTLMVGVMKSGVAGAVGISSTVSCVTSSDLLGSKIRNKIKNIYYKE